MRTHKLVRCLAFPILACLVAMILACGPQPTSTPIPTPDVEATVLARLAEAATTEAAKETEVARSVEQTLTAQPTAGPVPETPTRVPPTYMPSATPPPTYTRPPTPTRLPPTDTPTPGAVVYHTVRYGETLASIGLLYGVNPYAIARANGLADPNAIYAGQKLIIPQEGGTTLSPEPEVVISAEQAIGDYYSLIMQKQYAVAWEMLSDEFNAGIGITTLDKYISGWEESGPATIIEIEVVQSNGRATVTLILHYPKKRVDHKIRYELVRDMERGNHRFGYWLFESSKLLW